MGVFDKDKEAFGPIESDLLDMRFGNPAFLQPYWRNFNMEVISGSGKDMGYLDSYGSKSLKQTIKDIHRVIGNAKAIDKYVVMGVGASQIIAAAVYALDNSSVYAKAPYFSRFKQFTQFSGIGSEFSTVKRPHKQTVIVTCPNNPDGLHGRSDSKTAVYDLVYNWPQYTDVIKYDEDIMIFGLAKATGHASTRVGWALVRDKDVADRMQHYIEMSTCGVGVESLKMCERILRHLSIIEFQFTCFKHGKDKLRRRREKLAEVSKNKKFTILNDSGMFVWGKVEGEDANEFFEKTYGLLVVNGSYFGMPGHEYFRINLGCDVDSFTSFIDKLSVCKLWRQDDNGNKFMIAELPLSEARKRLKELESKKHKQMYWIDV